MVIPEVLASISIQPMTEHDLLEIVEIEEQSGLSRWGWAAYYAELKCTNRNLMLVARIDRGLRIDQNKEIAGYVVSRLSAGELHINNMAVRHEYRRQGIASALLRQVLKEAEETDAVEAILEVRAGNRSAQALYQACGFRVIGRRRNYYSYPVEDALIMAFDYNS